MKKIMVTAAVLLATTAVMAGNKEAKPYEAATAKISKMFKEAKNQAFFCEEGCFRIRRICICP